MNENFVFQLPGRGSFMMKVKLKLSWKKAFKAWVVILRIVNLFHHIWEWKHSDHLSRPHLLKDNTLPRTYKRNTILARMAVTKGKPSLHLFESPLSYPRTWRQEKVCKIERRWRFSSFAFLLNHWLCLCGRPFAFIHPPCFLTTFSSVIQESLY